MVSSRYATPSVIGIAYDPPGRRSFVNRLNPWDSYYEYDPASRLTALVNSRYGSPNDVRFEYGYNPSSQMTARWASADAYSWTDHVAGEKAYAVNGLNQYTSVAAAPHTYDANGNLITDGTNAYVYDAENRLVSGTAAGQTATLTYDPMGRLWQIVKGTANTRFLYDGDELVGEYDGAGTLVKRYLHGPSVDEPLIQYEGSGLSNRRFLGADERGSVILLTDTAGATVAINRYDEYGIPAATNVGRFQYTGQMWLGEISLYHYRARLYSPYLGRFLQTDPVGYEDDINLYTYVGNDPLNATDPTGRTCQPQTDGTFVCKIDEPGALKGEKLEEANQKYTDAVNKLMEDPDQKVTLTADAPTGSRIPLSETTTQGEIAQSLIQATVAYSQDAFIDSKGQPDALTRAITRGELGKSKIQMVLFPRAISRMFELSRTFVHEGAHPTQADEALFKKYELSGGKDWPNDHFRGYSRMAEEVLRR